MNILIKIGGVMALLFFCCELKSQTIKADTTWVLLTKENTPSKPRTMQPGRPLKYPDLRKRFKGIPTNLDTFQVYAMDFHPPQRAFQDFRNHEIDSTEYQRLVKRYRIDEKKMSYLPIKQQVNILSGIRNSEKIIICDANNDNSFVGEEIIKVSRKEKYKRYVIDSLKGINVKYEYYLYKQIKTLSVLLKIIPYDYKSYTFTDSLQQELAIFLSVAEYCSGNITVNNKRYEIRLPFPQVLAGNNYSDSYIFLYDSQGKAIPTNPPLRIGNSYNFLENFRVKFDFVSELGDSLRVIRYNTERNEIGYRVGEKIETLAFIDITNIPVNQTNGKKYTLIDFWGTWCGPCIEGLPKLKAFYENYKDRVNLISVAYDSDKEKVKQFIEKKQMPWMHKFESKTLLREDDLVKTLRVECFPTFILIDNSNNEILFRECGENKIQPLTIFLENRK